MWTKGKATLTKKTTINPGGAAPPAGPYSAAITFGRLLFISGQVPRDPESGAIIAGSVDLQTRATLDNVRALLDAAGFTFADVLKTTVFLTDMGDFPEMNAVYAEYFALPYPARSTVAVTALPLGARMEIEVIAGLDGERI